MRSEVRSWMGWGALFTCLLSVPPAFAADDPGDRSGEEASFEPASRHRLKWPGREFQVIDYVATGVLLGAAIAVDELTNPRQEPRWTGGILFDDAAQNLLQADTSESRATTHKISGYLALTPQIAAVVDGAAVPLFLDRFNFRVAWQMSLINVQAMSLNGLLSRSGHRGIGRERPDVEPCRDDPGFSERCGRGNNSSFPSGHTSTAFVGAGLVCAHHLAFPLYGHPIADGAACVVNTALATSAGLLRVSSGRHYLTDVIAGAAIGAGAGFVLPTLIYYRKKPRNPEEMAKWVVVPSLTRSSAGLGVAGIF